VDSVKECWNKAGNSGDSDSDGLVIEAEIETDLDKNIRLVELLEREEM